jgi:hypothetical protein
METLEDIANRKLMSNDWLSGAKFGAKWQAERMYTEEEVYELLLKHQSAYRSAVRNTSPLDWSFDIKQWFEQAKAMEKEQIIDSFGVGCQVESTRLIGYQDIAEQYYQETYGKTA